MTRAIFAILAGVGLACAAAPSSAADQTVYFTFKVHVEIVNPPANLKSAIVHCAVIGGGGLAWTGDAQVDWSGPVSSRDYVIDIRPSGTVTDPRYFNKYVCNLLMTTPAVTHAAPSAVGMTAPNDGAMIGPLPPR
jgi:hypothetical protein